MVESNRQSEGIDRPDHIFLYVALKTEDDLMRLDHLLKRNLLYTLPPHGVRMSPHGFDGDPARDVPVECGGNRPRLHVASASFEPQASTSGRSSGASGVLSFSERPDSVERWRDHGYRHRGVCLRFSTAGLLAADAHDVEARSDGRVGASARATIRDQGAHLHRVVSLNTAGEYEREWLWFIRGDRPPRIAASVIDGVVLGALMPDGLRDRVLGIVEERETPTSVYRARMDPDTMRLQTDHLP